MRIRFFTFLLLFSITGCNSYSKPTILITTSTPLSSLTLPEIPLATLTSIARPPYDFIVLNSPPAEIGLPKLIVDDDGTLGLTREKSTTSEYSKEILDINSGCLVAKVTASYSPDYKYVAIAKRCLAHENHESVYLIHSNGTGLVRSIIGYDKYESRTNRPIEWAPDSKSLIYFRSASAGLVDSYDDSHIEVFTGIFRYDIETAERKYLAPIWGQYKWNPNGKWIAVLDLDVRLNTPCKVLYILDSYGESLWELDSICENPSADTEILWQRDILVILQKELGNQNIIATKKYETKDMSSYRIVPIK